MRVMLRAELYQFVAFVLYPIWLVAGAGDYFCHRRTKIETTSGVPESWMHVAQYACILTVVLVAVFWALRGSALWVAALATVAHTALSYVDVRYTFSRRVISPLEQHMHAVLCIVPIVAVVLLALADADAAKNGWRQHALSPIQIVLLSSSILVVGGAPVLEEFVRTSRRKRSRTPLIEV